jgi:hypothetical protein
MHHVDVNGWVLVAGSLALALVGSWTVAHPDGGYRAAGGAGSGLTPAARRAAGFVLLFVAILLLALAGTSSG